MAIDEMIYHYLILIASKIRYLLVLVVLTMMFVSCGDDRTFEYENLTQHNKWIYEQMQSKYLWSGNLVEQQWKDYFAEPKDYLAKLTAKGSNDKWSYIVVDSIRSVDCRLRGNFHHANSYGFDYTISKDPTNSSTLSFARVLTIYKNSPAEKAGLRRNDYIETFDGYKITTKNSERLRNGVARKFKVHRLAANTEEFTYYWSDTRTVDIGASTYVEDTPFPYLNCYEVNGKIYGYLFCNSLSNGLTTDFHKFTAWQTDPLDEVMATLTTCGCDEFILDLRLCNFGTIDMARRLASYLVGKDNLDKVFAKTIYNEANSSLNKTITFDKDLKYNSISLKRVFVITSAYTQGAAEWVIRALRFALGTENVVTVGKTTAGQNVLTNHVGDYGDMLHLYPAVAYVADGNGDYESYSKGINADMEEDEFKYVELYDYGSLYEVLLNKCLTAK